VLGPIIGTLSNPTWRLLLGICSREVRRSVTKETRAFGSVNDVKVPSGLESRFNSVANTVADKLIGFLGR
jgi:hypothetical protein